MKTLCVWLLLLSVFIPVVAADKKLEIKDTTIQVMVEDEEVLYDIKFTAKNAKAGSALLVVAGEFGLMPEDNPLKKYKIEYLDVDKCYQVKFLKGGDISCQLKLIGKPNINQDTFSRSCALNILLPSNKSFAIGHKGLEKKFIVLNSIGVTNEKKDDVFYTKGFLGNSNSLVFSWESTENAGEGRLVASTQISSNIIVNANTLNLNHFFKFNVMQGKFQDLQIEVPAHLHITQVEGAYIQDWKISNDAKRILTIQLNRPQKKDYLLNIISELPIEALPSEITVPNLIVQGEFRTYGNVIVSTNSALQMVMKKTAGLTQVDQAEKDRAQRGLNLNKSFYYIHPSAIYDLVLSIKEIKPSFDVKQQLIVEAKEENLVLYAKLQLDVRDAPLKKVIVVYPEVFNISEIKGGLMNQRDFIISKHPELKGFKQVEIPLLKPVIGSFSFDLEMETGKEPIKAVSKMGALFVENANSERGSIVFVSSEGVFIDKPVVTELREVHTGSLAVKINDAKYAFRFRKNNWSFELKVATKETGIYTEGLHLLSLTDNVMYGSTAFSYRITGAPVDVLSFKILAGLQNIEFIGKDVVNWEKEGKEIYKVKLRKKVLGDYNIGVSFTQKIGEDGAILLGGVNCVGVDTQTGFVVLASQQNMMVKEINAAGMIEIPIDEIPKSYHLLINAPVIKSFKYVNENHNGRAIIEPFHKEELVTSLIEMMNVETKVFLREKGDAEAVTTVLYNIKNTNGQYLTLELPENAVIWSTKYLTSNSPTTSNEQGGQPSRENGTRITAAIEGKLVKIPLQRKQNPNEPLIIELQYGQSLGEMDKVFQLELMAPKANIEVTYSSWKLQVPENWVIQAKSGDNLLHAEGKIEDNNMQTFMSAFINGWMQGLSRCIATSDFIFVICILIGVLISYKLVVKVKLKDCFVLFVLALILFVGVYATLNGFFFVPKNNSGINNEMVFNRVLNISAGEGLAIAATVSTSWLYLIDYTSIVFLGLCLLFGIGLSFKFEIGRTVALASAVTMIFFIGIHLEAMRLVLMIILAWGLVSALMVYLVIKQIKAWRLLSKEVVAVALLLLCLPWGASTLQADEAPAVPPKKNMVINQNSRANYTVTVDKDHLKVVLKYKLFAEKDQLELLDSANILIDENKVLPKGVELQKKAAGYYLHFLKKGDIAVEISYLKPISKDVSAIKELYFKPVTAMFCDVVLTLPSKEFDVQSRNSFKVKKEVANTGIVYSASFLPANNIAIAWQPKTRDTKSEETVFYTDIVGLWKFSKGVVEGEYLVQYKIAQGELSKSLISLPKGVDVSSVGGDFIGSWGFDKEKRQLDVKFVKPISGNYCLRITFQTPQDKTPYDWKSFSLGVDSATRSTLEVGIAHSNDVFLGVQSSQVLMDSSDFKINYKKMAQQVPQSSNLDNLELKATYRFLKEQDNVSVLVNEVQSEMRIQEEISFSVEEDRQVYNANLQIDIAKAGVFYTTIEIPPLYDVDALGGDAVSHWDEIDDNGHRTLQVHFLKRVLGKITLTLTLSRNILVGVDDIIVPKVILPGSKKHEGFLIVSSGRGMQLRIKESHSASEKDPSTFNVFDKRAIAFKLLSEQWQVILRPEIMQPRVNLDFLHEVKISEGVVHHTHYLRYQPYNAGVKEFQVQLPKNIFGLRISGAQIANKKESVETPGLWTISLEEKWFDREYALTVFYEVSFEKDEYKVSQILAKDVDLVKGFIVVYSKDRVELTENSHDGEVQKSDSRNMPVKFGAGDLSLSSFSYTTNNQVYDLSYLVKRHLTAKLLSADCLSAKFNSVVNAEGDILTRAQLELLVGSKRNLEVELPMNAKIWSIVVNGRFENPYIRKGETKNRFLITLPNTSFVEKKVEIDFIYVFKGDQKHISKMAYQGPRFDLPLKNIEWTMFVPQNWEISEIEGTLLPVNKDNNFMPYQYSIRHYEDDVSGIMTSNNRKSKDFQKQAEDFNKNGQRKNAMDALQNAYNWSNMGNDVALNEDARVQLHQLNQEQAIVGMINRRNDIAKNMSGKVGGVEPLQDLDNLRQEEVSMLQNSIAQADNDNIGLICSNIVKTQETANMQNVQLYVNMPLSGKKIELTRSLQVKPFDNMEVDFQKIQVQNENHMSELLVLIGMIVALIVLFKGVRLL
jgi:hypothetical protein